MKYERLVEEAKKGETFELLKSGNVLLAMKTRFIEQPTNEHLFQFLDCLTDSLLYVPMNATVSDNDIEMLKSMKTGETIQFNNNVRMAPDYLQDEKGKLYIPIFSQVKQADEEYRDNFSTVWLHISEVIEFYKNPRKELNGIILDAHTKYLILDKELIKIIEDVMQYKEEKLKNNE